MEIKSFQQRDKIYEKSKKTGNFQWHLEIVLLAWLTKLVLEAILNKNLCFYI